MKLRNYFSILAIFFFFSISNASAATCSALGNGDWSNPLNWSCGSVPGCGDVIIIPVGVTVNIDMQVRLDENSMPACSTAVLIEVFGTLQFETGFKMELSCGSMVEIHVGGLLLPGGGGGMSNWLTICQNIEWSTSEGPVSGYKLFGSIIVLPFEFVSFEVGQEQEEFQCKWTMASESGTDYFQIHYSTDGLNWFEFVKRESVGDYTSPHVYTEVHSIDINEPLRQVYFKLSKTDLSGKKVDLDFQSFKLSETEISIYPNPVNKNQKLNFSKPDGNFEKSDVFIYNSLGNLVLETSITFEAGTNHQSIETGFLNSGIYFIHLPNLLDKTYRLIVE